MDDIVDALSSTLGILLAILALLGMTGALALPKLSFHFEGFLTGTCCGALVFVPVDDLVAGSDGGGRAGRDRRGVGTGYMATGSNGRLREVEAAIELDPDLTDPCFDA